LDVNGTANINGALTTYPPFNNILLNSGTQQILLANSSATVAPYLFVQSVSTATARIRIGSYSNASPMPVTFNENGGNVGIGTTAPGYTLDVNGSGNFVGNLTIKNGITIVNSNNAGTQAGYYQLYNNPTSGGGLIASTLQIFSYFTGAPIYNLLTMTPTGNVGIQTNAPAYPLDVNGNANVAATLTANTVTTAGLTINTGGAAYSALNFSNTADSNAMWMSFYKPSYTAHIGWGGYNLGGTPGYNNVFIIEATTTGSVIYLNAAGGVGIKNIAPAYALDVTGDINATGNVKVNGINLSSDERVKQNIEDANLSMCYSTFQQLTLRRFQWDSNYFPSTIKPDSHVLGFIAQEVHAVFPKAIHIKDDAFTGLSSFMSLNNEQIQYTHFGATRYITQVIEQQQSTIASLTQLCSVIPQLVASVSTLQG
jgi:hypothetical protein